MAEHRLDVRLLSLGPFVTMWDRFAIAPLLIPIAHEFRAPLGVVAITATVYYLLYGIGQPLWGFLSDRAGRIRVMRLSLAAVFLGCMLSALAPNLPLLIAARVITGLAVCAILPTALVYVGDVVPFRQRQAVVADLLAAVAVGTALGTVGAGLFAHFVTWRLAFAVPAAMAAALAVVFARLPEPPREPMTGGPLTQIRRAVARPWARFLILFALPEGAVMLGFVVYLAPALESTGENPAVAGLVVAAYGISVLIGTQVVKRIARVVAPWVPIAIGGPMVIAGYGAAALDQHVAGILVASVMIGGCYSFMHSGLQAWATDIAPDARGTATALFVTCAFTGGAAGSAAGAALAQAHRYPPLFLGALVLSLPVVAVAVIARTRYRGAAAAIEAAPT